MNKLNSEELDKLVEKYKTELEKHGINHLIGFKHRVQYYNDKLVELAEKCNVTPIQYLDVLDSNWRKLFDFQEKYFYDYIIRDYYKKDKRMKNTQNIKYMRLVLPVRYGEEDLPEFFPWRNGNILDFTYNIKTGEIHNPENTKIIVTPIIDWNKETKRVKRDKLEYLGIFELNNLKVVDEGCYYLLDENFNTLYSLEQEYVPDSHSVDGEYGDYINLHIDLINWKLVNFKKDATFKEFLDA